MTDYIREKCRKIKDETNKEKKAEDLTQAFKVEVKLGEDNNLKEKKELVCFNCGKPGHIKKNCWFH